MIKYKDSLSILCYEFYLTVRVIKKKRVIKNNPQIIEIAKVNKVIINQNKMKYWSTCWIIQEPNKLPVITVVPT